VRVDTAAIDVPTSFRGSDDYWQPFVVGQGPSPGYVTSLDPARRERLRSILPTAGDGRIELVARAWARGDAALIRAGALAAASPR
jgi:hypothetical protein